MRLGRSTPRQIIEIKAPRWKERTVGIATWRVGLHNEIRITYRRKGDGEFTYPDPFYISGDKIKKYPKQLVGGGTWLYLVPISDLEILENVD